MANRYFLNIGANYNATANWSDTSGGTGGFSVPTNADDVFFDANSGNCTVNVASVAKSVNFTGYTNTITMTNTLTVSGNVTLAAGMGVSGSSALIVNTTATLTSNGKTWSAGFTFAGASQTYTLADNWTVSGLLTLNTSSGNITINNNTLFLSGNLGTTGSGVIFGTTTIEFTAGTWTGGLAFFAINCTINGNVTISGTLNFSSATLTYISGTVTTTGSTLSCRGIPTVLNTNGINWNNVEFTVSTTITLTSNLTINGLLTNSSNNINGTFNINCNGGITLIQTLQQGAGSTTLNLLGGTWSATGANGVIRLNTTINGNITISGNVYYNTGTLTYTSGKAIANTATLNIGASSTFINCDKINFKTIIITAGTTQTFNRFFSGSAITPTRIQSTGANYTIAFQDGFEKITKFTKISNCTVSRPGQLLCITDKSNKGGNVGIRYINQMPNGIAKNAPTSPNPMAYGLPSFLDSDPNFITG